jgi:hypothetical protein
LALEGARAGIPTYLVEEVPIEERDFTGGEASELWRAVRRLATVVGAYEELAFEER